MSHQSQREVNLLNCLDLVWGHHLLGNLKVHEDQIGIAKQVGHDHVVFFEGVLADVQRIVVLVVAVGVEFKNGH